MINGENYILYMGDCLQVMKGFPDKSLDMILADLPYGTTQCKWDIVLPFNLLWEQYLRIAKDNAAIVLNASQPFTSALIMSNPELFRYEWIWEKGNATGFLNAKIQPLRAHESVLVFYNKLGIFNPQMSFDHVRRKTSRKVVNSECYGKALTTSEYDSTQRYPRSVQFFSSDKQIANYHPTQKPIALIDFLVKSYTNPGMKILDNTMGSGTTGVSAIKLGRKFIGIEKDPVIFETAKRRIANSWFVNPN